MKSIATALMIAISSLVALAQQVKVEYTNKNDSLSDYMSQYFPDFVDASPKMAHEFFYVEKRLDHLLLFGQE